MREFARLYTELDSTTATNRKLAALEAYFGAAPPADAAWAVYFLAGGKPRQAVPNRLLRQFAIERAALDEWLFDECHDAVGDFAETVAHILPPPLRESDIGLATWMDERILPLRGAEPEAVRAALFTWWEETAWRERFLLMKLIGGGFRVGVSRLLVTRALGAVAGIDAKHIAQRLMGWTDGRKRPSAERYLALIATDVDADVAERGGQPYPFFLAHPLQAAPDTLGDIGNWLAEWKYDGIRAQLVRRHGQTWLWSRGEDLITDRFPEISGIALPEGTVVDGEVLIWRDGRPAPFSELQKRIGRKTLSAKLLAELPASLVAYDLLEQDGVDLRQLPQRERRARLETLTAATSAPQLVLSPLIEAPDWESLETIRAESRSRAVEGMMLKGAEAQYGVGRTRDVGTWWKWKIDPFSVDAVLIYAQAGHGRRASLYTDYTFAVWDEGPDGERRLVPFAKAYSGLTDAEIARVDAIIRRTTVEKFGPVRSVRPTMVFEIGFEGIAASSRHKAGIAVRFPRMLRIRDDKPIEEADTLDTLKGMLA
ncbi:ATP-dependent DNA ligase [Noviherbaspirillum pedocola]|uniref:DNA ligase (ATP) n=1 Tax=Noviherbaspirillum pedocola TaxID=2801341 RepID=A0A934W7L9_9BURK|nr:ATP-dependent DNA ligase [Noviherbaspirillum pedocola]MBK4735748.1 ATP-dependent DNA ligase [Noviherbaspirillum pedocola]